MFTRMVSVWIPKLVALQLFAAGPSDFFNQVREQANALARVPYRESTNHAPEALLRLNYVQSQAIRFKPAQALWAKEELPFEIEFILPDAMHRDTVVINELTDQGSRRVRFSAEEFDFGTNKFDLPSDLQYAGLRIAHPPHGFGEIAVFLGGSYFRMVGRGQCFGASARGLALDTANLGHEEFPRFREFWLQKPKRRDRALTLWALLDSPSVTGAYQFTITPGQTTVADTRVALFPRREISQFGLAPVTSMFLHDENSHPPMVDFRPEVHDSDGLLLETGEGKVLWRPLEAGKMMRVNAYQDVNPRGFGLMQRDRDFEHYQDLVGRFEARPGVWVKPLGNWGRGSVVLIQLPTNIEYTDNVTAFWVPAVPPKAGASLDLAYQVHWLTNQLGAPSLGHVRDTRMGMVQTGATNQAPNLRFVIDFDGPVMQSLPSREQIDAEVEYGAGTKFIADTVAKNPINGTWRLVLEFSQPTKAVDLQARLKRAGRTISETWTFTWQP